MAIKGFTPPDSNSNRKKTDKTGTGRPTVVAPNKLQGSSIRGSSGQSGNIPSKITSITPPPVGSPWSPPPGGAPGVANSDWAGVAQTGQYAPPNLNPGGGGGTGGGMDVGGTPGGGSLATPPLGYSNLGLSQTLYSSDPQTRNSFAMNWLLQNGLTDNPVVAELVGDLITPGLYQFMLQTGGTGDQSDAAVANYIVDQFVKLTTPGAAMNDSGAMLEALFNASGDSPLGAAIGYGTALPQDQVNQTDAFLQSAIYGLNPLAQRAYMNASDAAGMRYLAGANQDPTQMTNYGDFLRTQGISGWRV